MSRYQFSVATAAALTNGSAIASIVPAAAIACKIRRISGGVLVSGGGTPTSVQVAVGINRGTARGTSSTTATGVNMYPQGPASAITGVDTAWSVQPTLAAADVWTIPFNDQLYIDSAWELLEEFFTTVGTANPVVLVNRSSATLPGNHFFQISIETEE